MVELNTVTAADFVELTGREPGEPVAVAAVVNGKWTERVVKASEVPDRAVKHAERDCYIGVSSRPEDELGNRERGAADKVAGCFVLFAVMALAKIGHRY